MPVIEHGDLDRAGYTVKKGLWHGDILRGTKWKFDGLKWL